MEVIISSRFNGPPNSGNGGYVCGLISREMKGSCEVKLLLPSPLDKKLSLKKSPGAVELYDSDSLLAFGKSVEIIEHPCEFIAYEDAIIGSGNGAHFLRAQTPTATLFSTCFVCGIDRDEGDGLRLSPGPQTTELEEEREYPVSTNWIPDSTLSADGLEVSEEFIWSVMDCTGAWALHYSRDRAEIGDKLILLGKFSNRIYRAPQVDENCVLVAEYIAKEGRKLFSKVSLFSAEAELLANAVATWVMLKTENE